MTLVSHTRLPRRAWYALYAAWILSLAASLGALFLSHIVRLAPCELCWYQRTFMFPLVFVLGAALAASDDRAPLYALPLAVGGWLVALYHTLLYGGYIPQDLQPCGQGPSCSDADLNLLGVVPIPLLSLVAFTAIIVTLMLSRRK